MAIILALPSWAAGPPSKSALLERTKQPPEGTVTAGNSIYQVHVEDVASSNGVGTYTVTTGVAHPSGSGLNVLFGDGSPGTSYNTVRSFTTGTDYVLADFSPSSGNTVVELDPFGVVTPLGSTGFRTTYALPGPTTTPDALTIISDVNVNGTTIADSTVEVTTTVVNDGNAPVEIGIRYLWDVQIGSDDGPSFQAISPDGPALVIESEFAPPGFLLYRIEDNGVNPSPPTFNVFGTATGPAAVTPSPTTPDLLQFVFWGASVDEAFDYTLGPFDVASGGGDSAVLYFFGPDMASAVTIPPGGQHTVSASLLAGEPGEPPILRPGLYEIPTLSGRGAVVFIVLLLSLAVLYLGRMRS